MAVARVKRGRERKRNSGAIDEESNDGWIDAKKKPNKVTRNIS